ncbi:hypothetical protein ONS95_003419 [Cadophora gregata]|uniref:uncharacterized protein n=1 Tax=Cadophora gregata TaxID=51156 RepID=UPI0026DBD7F7|nr:uncharacterized protein ONS95_003419 [Cadophora gregata]KAK0108626.1 hypothetical protein ONS95_003419 [Cadophora gregata]
MPPLSTQASTAIKLSIAFLSIAITAFYLFSGSADITHRGYRAIYQTAVKGKKGLFVESLLADENEIDGPFNNGTLVELCRTRHWTPGLIFKCEAPEGGIGNVRNVFLNCVRYAIEAGATGFIVPEILLRTTASPDGTNVPFTHYFDLDHFTTTLHQTCPRIQLIAHQNDLFDLPSTAIPVPLVPTSITISLIGGFILGAPGNWSQDFHSFLNITHPVPPSATKPILVSLAAPLMQFPLTYDDPHLVAQFGRILRFRPDVRRIAATTVYALNTKYKLGLQPRRDVIQGKFYGAHLRTGQDAVAAGWTAYGVQEHNYIAHARKANLALIYLTSTTEQDVEAFRNTAANALMSVETKESLLASVSSPESPSVYTPLKGFEEEWKLLQGLSWDQQLLVDFEVLLRSSLFGGMWESSFSWNVAMRRHVVASGAKGWTSIAERGEGVNNSAPPVKRGITGRAFDGIEGGLVGRQDVESENAPPKPEEAADPETPTEPDSPPSSDASPSPDSPPTDPAASEPQPAAETEPEPEPEPEPPTTPNTSAPPTEHPGFTPENPATLSATETDLENRLEAEKNAAGPPAKIESDGAAKEGEASFRDALSVVFGPVGEGRRVRGSLWP